MTKINTRPPPEFGNDQQWSAYVYQDRKFITAYAATEKSAVKKLGEMLADAADPFTTEQIENALVMRELSAVCDHNLRDVKEWYGNGLATVSELQEAR